MATLLAIVSLALTVAALVVAWNAGEGFASIAQFVPFTLVSGAVGLLITHRRPDNAFGLLLSAVGAVIALTNLLNTLSVVITAPRAMAIGSIVGNQVFALFLILVFVLLPLWFPTGSAINRRWALIGWAAISLVPMALIAGAVSYPICIQSDRTGCLAWEPNPFGWSLVREEMTSWFILPIVVLAVLAFFGLGVRFRHSSTIERLQIRWLLFAVALSMAVFALAFPAVQEVLRLDLPDWLMNAAVSTCFTFIPLACAIAILRYHLYDIDRVISRTIGYSVVVGLLVGLLALLATIVGTRFDSPFVVAATTLGVAAAFNPLRRRVQGWVDLRFNRSSYDAEVVMDDFAGSLRDRLDADTVVDGWVGVVSQTMQPSAMGVWVRDGQP